MWALALFLLWYGQRRQGYVQRVVDQSGIGQIVPGIVGGEP